jgi:hypothetical protein
MRITIKGMMGFTAAVSLLLALYKILNGLLLLVLIQASVTWQISKSNRRFALLWFVFLSFFNIIISFILCLCYINFNKFLFFIIILFILTPLNTGFAIAWVMPTLLGSDRVCRRILECSLVVISILIPISIWHTR